MTTVSVAGVPGVPRQVAEPHRHGARGALITQGVNALLDIWPEGKGNVLVPGSALLAPTFVASLQAKGYTAQLVPVYTMKVIASAPAEVVEAWKESRYDAVVIASGSSALAVSSLLGWNPDTAVIAVGESAAAVLNRVGVDVAGETGSYLPEDTVELLRGIIERRNQQS